MSLTPSADWEPILQHKDFLLAIWRKRLAFQLRHGPISNEHIQRAMPRILHFARSGKPFGALLVVAAGAPIPSDDTRAEQKKFLQTLALNPLGRVALVALGDDLQANLYRSLSRMMALQHPHLRSFSEVAPACSWLAGQLSSSGFPLLSADIELAYSSFTSSAP
jgi:hypothetical protein